jgi:hypothetical protein
VHLARTPINVSNSSAKIQKKKEKHNAFLNILTTGATFLRSPMQPTTPPRGHLGIKVISQQQYINPELRAKKCLIIYINLNLYIIIRIDAGVHFLNDQ